MRVNRIPKIVLNTRGAACGGRSVAPFDGERLGPRVVVNVPCEPFVEGHVCVERAQGIAAENTKGTSCKRCHEGSKADSQEIRSVHTEQTQRQRHITPHPRKPQSLTTC